MTRTAAVGVEATHRHHISRAVLIALQFTALAGQIWAVHLARLGQQGVAENLSTASMGLMFGSAVWALTRPRLTRVTRNIAIACLAVTPTLMVRAADPLLFSGFDEQLHMRTLRDIIASHGLFQLNPVLEVSPRYPGLEAVTVLLHETGLPVMVAALVVILTARLVFVFVLADAVELLTESSRAGGLAVAIYAMSPQFVWFNSQFAYQTMSLPLALGAVSLLGRARNAQQPLPLFGGATVCLLAVAMTHHLTSFLTGLFLIAWTLTERGQARMMVAYGALASFASAVLWAIGQRSTLEGYFGPMINDLTAEVSGGVRRQAFQNSAGTSTPLMDKALLLLYAVALTVTIMVLFLLTLRWIRRREHDLYYWNPQLLVLGLSLAIPVLLAARVVPKGVEIFTRSSSFLFLPLSFVLVNYMGRLDWWKMGRLPGRPPQDVAREPARHELVWHIAATILASAVFLGGFVLGSGPSWARLPGPYMAGADSRSMDPENLAATEWAGRALPPGSRIGADRVSAILLADEGLWPVYGGVGGVKIPELYVPKSWGLEETDKASALMVRYLYVDRRMADQLPAYGVYFASGEAGEGKQLTDVQLTKFDRVPAIKLVYRHGPISIYDLKGLGLTDYRNGWTGRTPSLGLTQQVAVGLAVGLLLAVAIRSRYWPRIVEQAAVARRAFGPALTAVVLLAAACLLSVGLLLTHVWLTPLTVVCAALVIAVANPAGATARARRAAAAVTWRRVGVTLSFLVPFSVLVGLSIRDAAVEDVVEVHQILDDPDAVHIPPASTGTGG